MSYGSEPARSSKIMMRLGTCTASRLVYTAIFFTKSSHLMRALRSVTRCCTRTSVIFSRTAYRSWYSPCTVWKVIWCTPSKPLCVPVAT